METATNETPSTPEMQPGPPERSRAWRIVAIVLTLHAALLGAVVLIQGCSKSESPALSENARTSNIEDEHDLAKVDQPAAGNVVTPLPGGDMLTPEENLPNANVAQGTPPAATIPQPQPLAHTEPVTAEAPHTVTEPPSAHEKARDPIMAAPVTPAKTTATIKYVVKKGDTLSRIAKKYTVSVREIASVNKMTEKTALKIGQKLVVPGASRAEVAKIEPATSSAPSMPVDATVSSGEAKNHVVKRGDTPISIAKRYGVTVDSLMRVNHIADARKIRVNQKLVIPTPKVARETPPSKEIQPASGVEPVDKGHEVKRI